MIFPSKKFFFVFFLILTSAIIVGILFGRVIFDKYFSQLSKEKESVVLGNSFPLPKNEKNVYYFFCNLNKIEKLSYKFDENLKITHRGECNYKKKDGKFSTIYLPLGYIDSNYSETLIIGKGVYPAIFSEEAIENILNAFVGKEVGISFSEDISDRVKSDVSSPERIISEFNSKTNSLQFTKDFLENGSNEGMTTIERKKILVPFSMSILSL